MTAGNASGVNDGAAALIVASADAVAKYGLTPKARIIVDGDGWRAPRASWGSDPRPPLRRCWIATASRSAISTLIELNEAFAAQGLATMRQLGLPDDADHVNPHGGAIALGHPLGMSGARLALTAAINLSDAKARRAICTMCIGVGQGIALMLEAV